MKSLSAAETKIKSSRFCPGTKERLTAIRTNQMATLHILAQTIWIGCNKFEMGEKNNNTVGTFFC